MRDHSHNDYLQGLLSSSLASCITSLGGVQAISAEEWEALAESQNTRLVVLTLSGYSLRCLLALVADGTNATRSMDDDELQELANNLCGTLKRQLSAVFPQLGMSTPNALPVACIAYLQEAEQLMMAVHGVATDGSSLTACLLVLQADDDWAPPAAQLNAPEPEVLGELELF